MSSNIIVSTDIPLDVINKGKVRDIYQIDFLSKAINRRERPNNLPDDQ